MSTNKGRERSGKANPIRRLTDAARRGIACLLSTSIVITCLPGSVILAGAEADDGTKTEKEVEICSVKLDALCNAIEDEVRKGEPADEDKLEFSGKNAGEYETLFDTKDGLLYEIYPDLDEECDDLTLRTFVRLKKSGTAKYIEGEEKTDNGTGKEPGPEENADDNDLLSGYNVTGDEEIIFLLMNNTEDRVNARIYVTTPDEVYETKKITVPGNKNSAHIPQYTVESMSNVKYFVIDDKEENVKIAAHRVESGSDADKEFDDPELTDPEEESEEKKGAEEKERTEELEETEESEGTAEAGPAGNMNAEENGVSADAEILSAESASSDNLLNAAAESSSNAFGFAFDEGCVPMKGKLYDPAIVDGTKAVAFVTTLKDLGFESSAARYSLVYEGTDYTITLEYDSDAGIPEDAELSGDEYEADSDTYKERFEEAKVLYNWEDGAEPSVRLFDVSLMSDEEEIEPDTPVQVTITFHDEEYEDTIAILSSDEEVRYEDGDDVTYNEGNERDSESAIEDQPFTITHFGANGTETIKSETSYDESGHSVTFTLKSLSDIMVLATVSGNYKTIVLNLGNGNGTSNNKDYAGSSTTASYMRYEVSLSGLEANDDGTVTINLPGNGDLGKSFTVKENKTVTLGTPQKYAYKLVGWYNLGDGQYTDVSNGSAPVTISLDHYNIFYADWIAASYDYAGTQADRVSLRDDIVSTSDFVSIEMYDFNDLLNLYGSYAYITSTQSGFGSNVDHRSIKETWYADVYQHDTPYDISDGYSVNSNLSNTARTDDRMVTNSHSTSPYNISSGYGTSVRNSTNSLSFLFRNQQTVDGYNMLFYPGSWREQGVWNANYYQVMDDGVNNSHPQYARSAWGIDSPGAPLLEWLFNDDTLGSHYIGSADNLFWIDENGDYVFDASEATAVYNQTDERFYVYDIVRNITTAAADGTYFLPYNSADSNGLSVSDGSINYWFGMKMTVNMYLNEDTGSTGDPTNLGKDNKHTAFTFRGDDDILIFVDGDLILDMSGTHAAAQGQIDFSEGTYKVGAGSGTAFTTTFSDYSGDIKLTAGAHTIEVFYVERGADESNLRIEFNVPPAWRYESGPVQTVTAEKTWLKADGTEIEPDKYEDELPGITAGLYEGLGQAAQGEENGYTKSGNDSSGYSYTYTFKDPETGSQTIYTFITTVTGGVETPVSFSDGTSAYSETNDEGWIIDNDGRPLAKLERGILWILIDEQELNEENGWYYAWDLLDADCSYMTMETSSGEIYKLKDTVTTEADVYPYWTVVGEEEIEDGGSVGLTCAVILTDAAQHNEAIGNEDEAKGYVIVCSEEGELTLKEIMFSQHTTFETKYDKEGDLYYYSICGVCSAADIEELGSRALWYLEPYSEGIIVDSNGKRIQPFYIYCENPDGTKHYLTIRVTGDGENKTCAVITTADREDLFFYDSLGELIAYDNSTQNPGLGDEFIVTISKDSSGELYVRAHAAGEAPDANDVRFYTLDENYGSAVSEVTFSNQLLPDFTLEKEDSITREPLENVSFTLVSEDGLYYGGLPEEVSSDEIGSDETDENVVKVIWHEEYKEIMTGSDGKIIFRYIPDGIYILTEKNTLDGYTLLPASVKITVTEGKITKIEWEPSDGSLPGIDGEGGYVTISDDGLTIVVENFDGSRLPDTGGPGTFLLKLTGLLLMGGTVLLCLILKRRRRVKADTGT